MLRVYPKLERAMGLFLHPISSIPVSLGVATPQGHKAPWCNLPIRG